MVPFEYSAAVELARAIAKGDLRLLCTTMCLAPAFTNDPKDAVLRGSGLIESTGRGGLRYRLVFDGPLPPTHWTARDRPAHVESLDQLYRLVALDSRGREWRSTPVRAQFSPVGALHGPTEVAEALDAIMYRDPKPRDEQPSVVLVCPRRPPMQLTMSGWTRTVHSRAGQEVLVQDSADHCEYETERCSVRIELGDPDLLLAVVTPLDAEMVPMGFEQRFLDALALVMGQRTAPSLSLRTQGGHQDWHISRGPYIDPPGMLRPPILATPGPTREGIWTLAARYQETVAAEWPRVFGEHDPLSEALSEIALGSQGTLQSASLSLAIGIEAMGHATRLRQRYPPSSTSSLDLDGAIAHVEAWETGDAATRDFVIRRLSNLKGPDFASCLYQFADAKGIDHRVISAWKAARPRLAHGGGAGDAGSSDIDREHEVYQASVDTYYTMLALMYRIVADFVGYDGPLVDYSLPDWGIDPSLL